MMLSERLTILFVYEVQNIILFFFQLIYNIIVHLFYEAFIFL